MRGIPLFRHLACVAALFFVGSSLAVHADDTPAVIATGQGAAVAISNWTTFTLQQTSAEATNQNAGLAGPGFPFALWPMQTGGTAIVMRGGPESEGAVSTSYFIQNDADPNPGFTIGFEADSDWNFKAAASLLLNAGKSYAIGKAKKSVKKTFTAKGEADSAVEDDPEDGVAEVIKAIKEVKFYYKLVKLIAKLVEALIPQFVMNIDLTPIPGTTQVTNACLSKYQSTPGVANVQIFGPDETITANNADSFFVVAAGAANGFSPGLVDVGVNSLCDWVCGAWSGSLELLTTMDRSGCEDVVRQTDSAASDYEETQTQNNCLAAAVSGPGGVPWVAPEFATDVWFHNPDASCHPDRIQYSAADSNAGSVANSICGACPGPAYETPMGDWAESCDTVSWVPDQDTTSDPVSIRDQVTGIATGLTDSVSTFWGTTPTLAGAESHVEGRMTGSGGTLTAKCAPASSSERTVESTLQCATGYWTSVDGQLACEKPPGDWQNQCVFVSYHNGTLCADCVGLGGGSSSCATCPSGSWYSALGEQLMCDSPSSDSQADKRSPRDPRSPDPFPTNGEANETQLANRPLSNRGTN